MPIRLKALLMLFVVGLVLPVAGVQQRFCMESRVVVAADSACSACPRESGQDCHKDTNGPSKPTCMASAKFLPDATAPLWFTLPAPQAVDLLGARAWLDTGEAEGFRQPPPVVDADGAASGPPPGWLRVWQFVFRAAGVPRAPSADC